MAEPHETQSFFSRMTTDAVLISIASAVSYMVAYSYQKSYYSYFGVPAEFVELSLDRVLFAVSFLTTSFWFVWQFMLFISGLAPILTSNILKALFLKFTVEIALFSLSLLLYFASGVNWFTLGAMCLLGGFFAVDVAGLAKKYRKGEGWKIWIAERSSLQINEKRKRDFDDWLIERIGFANWVMLPILLFLLPTFGSLVGTYFAEKTRYFETLNTDNKEYILLGQKTDSWVFTEVLANAPTGNVLIWRVDPAKPLSLVGKRFPDGIASVGARKSNPTFKDWYNANWGKDEDLLSGQISRSAFGPK